MLKLVRSRLSHANVMATTLAAGSLLCAVVALAPAEALAAPAALVANSANPASLPEPGGTFTNIVSVTNTSGASENVALLESDVYGNLNGRGTCAIGSAVAPGATYSCSYPGVFLGNANDAQTTTVTAKVTDPLIQGSLAEDADAFTVRISDVLPAITVTNIPNPAARPTPGGNFDYNVVVRNGSSEAAQLTVLADSVYGNLSGRGTCVTGASVPPGGSYRCIHSAVFAGVPGASQTSSTVAQVKDDDGNTATGRADALVRVALSGHRCHGKAATLVGTSGADAIRGTAGRDVIVGLGGGDTIRGLGDGDRVCGGPGNDRLYGGSGRDRLYGGSGRDRLYGGSGPDRLYGDSGRDRLLGGGGLDLLRGGSGRDRVRQ